jgi:hypothetical protein
LGTFGPVAKSTAGCGQAKPTLKNCYNQIMNCPICKKEMKIIRTDVSNNQKQGTDYKEYDRTVYHCEADDAWANTEIPKST